MEANHPAAPPAPPCHPPAKGEAAELVDWLQSMRELAGEHNPEEQRRYDRAAELLQQQQVEIEQLKQQLETERMSLAVDLVVRQNIDGLLNAGCTLQQARELLNRELDWRHSPIRKG